jgi:pentatricopeptide repeat protein
MSTVVVMLGCRLLQELGKVLELRRRMQKAGTGLDVVSCNTLLNAYAGKGRWEDALAFLQRMPSIGVTPNR